MGIIVGYAMRAVSDNRRVGGSAGARANYVAAVWLALIVGSSALLLAVTGNALLALVPVVATTALYVMSKLPVRVLLLALLFVALGIFAPSEAEASGALWSALRPVSDFLYVYLNRSTGIGALAVKGLEVSYASLVLLIMVRAARGARIDAAGRTPVANVLVVVSVASLAGVVMLELWGIVRGGDVRGSLFQIRQLLVLPVLTLLFCYALRGPDDFRRLALIITAAACVKIGLGAFYLLHDAWPKGVRPPAMTSHHDSVLFGAVLFMWCASWVHRPSARSLLPLAGIAGWIIVGLILNNRRIVYVSLIASLLIMYLMLHGPVKRRMTLILMRSLPLVLVYLFLSRTHDTGIFAPGAAVMSVSKVRDPSALWRDLENVNLLATLGYNKVLGTGWGHEYLEVVRAADISKYMPQYRLVPHNSILWLLGIGGMLGFALIWMPIVVGAFLASRSYYFSRTPFERTAAISALAVLVMYGNQCWGDMGSQGDTSMLLVACALAVSGKLARSTGAWPSSARVFQARGPAPMPPRARPRATGLA